MGLDFANAKLPNMAPLEASFAADDIEADLKRLFIDLFITYLASDTFDANVLGASHLGSIDLVRQAVNSDGLVLLQGDREEAAMRYLYRAWKSGNAQGRGLHFLRTYLQLLFPNDCDVVQMVHENEPGKDYPQWLHRLTPGYSMHVWRLGEEDCFLDGSWNLDTNYYHADESMSPDEISMHLLYLTSRVEVTLGESVSPESIDKIAGLLSSVIGLRFVLSFRFWRDRVLSEPDDIDRWYLGDTAGSLGDKVLTNITEWTNRS